jgi:hypothetical protein
MKILYVEDELERNIPRVNNLFAKYLTETQKKKLSALEIDDSGFGGDPQAIEEIVNSTGVVDCYHSFVDGLGKVLNNNEDYSIFIVDRNLVNCHYDYDAVRAIDPHLPSNSMKLFSSVKAITYYTDWSMLRLMSAIVFTFLLPMAPTMN